MFDNIIEFCSNPDNRTFLGWLGSGAVAIASGIWTIVKWRNAENNNKKPAAAQFSEGGITVGGDVTHSKLTIKTYKKNYK